MAGWEGSNRRQTLPPNWAEIRSRILKRDGGRCQWVRGDTQRKCLRPATDVDHRISSADGGTDDDSNLQSLCGWHHRWKSSHEGGQASGAARRAHKQAAPKPVHPGLVADRRELEPPPF
ncbi:HNH endonuclease [Humibacter sp. RRB41]|uniref:HNH endonuclease n=1 Tax=Humibacter sp. RRB41 TaxID=2919946 RepID=UPI001FAA1D66|nr:HNH endonuclease signature motif containing protein [Humibacter sp. RRB41]